MTNTTLTPAQVETLYNECFDKQLFIAFFGTTSFHTVSDDLLNNMFDYLKGMQDKRPLSEQPRRKVMQVKQLTESEIRNSKEREYNPSTWESRIDGFAKYADVKFYEEINSINAYTSYYAVYTAEGLTYMNSVSYSLSVSSNGFCKIEIDEQTGDVYRVLFNFSNDRWGHAENTPANRSRLKDMNAKFAMILTNKF